MFCFARRKGWLALTRRFGIDVERREKLVRSPLTVAVIVGIDCARELTQVVVDIIRDVARVLGIKMISVFRDHAGACERNSHLSGAGCTRGRRIAPSARVAKFHEALVQHRGWCATARSQATVVVVRDGGGRRTWASTGRDLQLGTAICMISVARRRMAEPDVGAVTITAIIAAMSLTA